MQRIGRCTPKTDAMLAFSIHRHSSTARLPKLKHALWVVHVTPLVSANPTCLVPIEHAFLR